jgi:hypothetical protein
MNKSASFDSKLQSLKSVKQLHATAESSTAPFHHVDEVETGVKTAPSLEDGATLPYETLTHGSLTYHRYYFEEVGSATDKPAKPASAFTDFFPGRLAAAGTLSAMTLSGLAAIAHSQTHPESPPRAKAGMRQNSLKFAGSDGRIAHHVAVPQKPQLLSSQSWSSAAKQQMPQQPAPSPKMEAALAPSAEPSETATKLSHKLSDKLSDLITLQPPVQVTLLKPQPSAQDQSTAQPAKATESTPAPVTKSVQNLNQSSQPDNPFDLMQMNLHLTNDAPGASLQPAKPQSSSSPVQDQVSQNQASPQLVPDNSLTPGSVRSNQPDNQLDTAQLNWVDNLIGNAITFNPQVSLQHAVGQLQ